MWLVSWLSSRASRVLEWFGSFYSSAVYKLRNFYGKLYEYAQKAYRWARDWAYPQILKYYYKARDRVSAALSTAWSWIVRETAEVRAWARGKIEAARSLATSAWHLATGAWDIVKSRVISRIESAKAVLRGWSLAKIAQALNPFKWVQAYKEFIKSIQNLLTAENINRLRVLLGSGFGFLLQIISRPLQTLLAVIQPIFLELLSFTLAYALGTVEQTLPDWPDWSAGIGGRLPGPAVSGQVVKRDLVAPLQKLYISGYRFREGHRALDLGLANGAPVYAMHAGVIEYTNVSAAGYGVQVVVSGADWWSRYAHFQELAVRTGQQVERGQLIGYGNSTGNSTGPHLHLELKYKGQFIDPEQVLF